MKQESKSINVFIAIDQTEFLTEDACTHYEKNILEQAENIKYFRYCTSRDLNETGMFYHFNYAAVYIKGYDNCYEEVLMQYLLGIHNGKLLITNVQGYGVMSAFSIQAIDKARYFEKEPQTWGGRNTSTEQILLSEKSFDGYPEAINFISKAIEYK